jgi:hypothetical protein
MTIEQRNEAAELRPLDLAVYDELVKIRRAIEALKED